MTDTEAKSPYLKYKMDSNETCHDWRLFSRKHIKYKQRLLFSMKIYFEDSKSIKIWQINNY